jgi:hypothetical protein
MCSQKLKSGDNSRNIQVNGNLTCGITYTEARQIALDVFHANCQKLMSEAVKTSEIRVNEIVDEFIKRLFEEQPELSYRLQDPSIQYSTFSVIKNYVKTGDVDLKERLLQLLIQRMGAKDRSLEQIVLDEAIEILPKLTQDIIDILTLVFSAVYLNHNVVNLDTFNNFINNRLMAFYPDRRSNSIYTHLQFTGCCSQLTEGATYKPFPSIIKNRYGGLFNKGFSKEQLEQKIPVNYEQISPIITSCQQNKSLLQFNAINEEVLKEVLKKHHLEHLSSTILQFHNQCEMTEKEIANYLCSVNPKMKAFMDEWKGERSGLKTIAPTSVGYAIAILNYNLKTKSNITFNGFI